MSYIVTIIVIANILSVLYATDNNRLTWSIGLVASVLTTIIFAIDGMYMSSLYNLYSSIICICGIILWNKNKSDNIKTLIRQDFFTNCLYTLWLFLGIGIINIVIVKSEHALLDSVGTATAIIGMLLLVKKNIYAWIFFILGDIAYITLSFVTHDWKYLIIYGVLFIFAVHGYIKNTILFNNNIKQEHGKI